jgi:hypothetical protein
MILWRAGQTLSAHDWAHAVQPLVRRQRVQHARAGSAAHTLPEQRTLGGAAAPLPEEKDLR